MKIEKIAVNPAATFIPIIEFKDIRNIRLKMGSYLSEIKFVKMSPLVNKLREEINKSNKKKIFSSLSKKDKFSFFSLSIKAINIKAVAMIAPP